MTDKLPETYRAIPALQACAREMYEVASAHGFHEGETLGTIPANFGAWMANLHSEVSELWEAYRKGLLNEGCDKGGLTCAEEELADIIIRAMDTAVALGVDIGTAIARKAEYNSKRPESMTKAQRADALLCAAKHWQNETCRCQDCICGVTCDLLENFPAECGLRGWLIWASAALSEAAALGFSLVNDDVQAWRKAATARRSPATSRPVACGARTGRRSRSTGG